MGVFDDIKNGLGKVAHVLSAPVRLAAAPIDFAIAVGKGENVGKAMKNGAITMATGGFKTPGGSFTDKVYTDLGVPIPGQPTPMTKEQKVAYAKKLQAMSKAQKAVKNDQGALVSSITKAYVATAHVRGAPPPGDTVTPLGTFSEEANVVMIAATGAIGLFIVYKLAF